jgi:predicted nucleotidyltransferase
MFKHCINMENEIIKNVASWGNGAGILLPKEWIGNQVKVILIDRTLEIKREVLNILEPYLEDILGIYLVGSYARGEQDSKSDIDILAISNKTKKEIKSGKYNVSISIFESLKKTAIIQPELILPRIKEAKVILNPILLKEIDKKISKSSFKEFYEGSKRMLKVSKEFIEIDKEGGSELESHAVIYSLMLRLRGLFLIKCLISDEKYSKKSFEKWILSCVDKKEFDICYEIYRLEKDEKPSKMIRISIETAKKIFYFLEKELEYLK